MFFKLFSPGRVFFSGCRLTLAAVAMLAAGHFPANAEVVLLVNVSNPSAVTFTATSAFSAINSSSTVNFDGITVMSFLTSTPSGHAGEQFTTSTLRPSNLASSDAYTGYQTDFPFPVPGVNLEMYNNGGTATQVFSTTAAALVGQFVADLDAGGYTAYLPIVGATGDVIAGYPGSSGGVIGTWLVTSSSAVPEIDPATGSSALSLVAGVLAMIEQRRRRAAIVA